MAAIEWSERKKMLVTAGVGLAINLCAGYYLYMLHQDLTAKEKVHKQLRVDIDGLAKYVQEGSIKEITLGKRKAEFQTKESKLPDSERRGELINEVTRLATKYKVEQVQIVFQEGVPDPNKAYVKDVWHTRWKADFFSWCKLMNEMEERFPRFVAFESMVFTITNNGMIPSGTRHEISCDIITYRYTRNKLGNQ